MFKWGWLSQWSKLRLNLDCDWRPHWIELITFSKKKYEKQNYWGTFGSKFLKKLKILKCIYFLKYYYIYPLIFTRNEINFYIIGVKHLIQVRSILKNFQNYRIKRVSFCIGLEREYIKKGKHMFGDWLRKNWPWKPN